MTNGEKILQIFPQSKEEIKGIRAQFIIDGYCYEFSKCWWEAEYEDPEEIEK